MVRYKIETVGKMDPGMAVLESAESEEDEENMSLLAIETDLEVC